MHVVDEERAGPAESTSPRCELVEVGRFLHGRLEGMGTHAHDAAKAMRNQRVPDPMQQMGLAYAGLADDEEGIRPRARLFADTATHPEGETVRRPLDELVNTVLRE